jgi:hypothetical protein
VGWAMVGWAATGRCRLASVSRPGEAVQDEAWFLAPMEALGVLVGMAAGQPVTVKVADATVPLWRPLAWKVSFRPG